MPLFGRNPDQPSRPRTSQERERARLEREARRTGKPRPAAPAAQTPPEPPAPAPAPAAAAPTPDPEPPVPVPEPPAPEPEPPAPEPPAPEQVVPQTRELPDFPAPREPFRSQEPGAGSEAAASVRRVTAAERGGPPAPPRDFNAAGTEADDEPPRHSPRGPLVIAAAAVAIAVFVWFVGSVFQPFKGDGGAKIAVTVPRGSGVDEIATLLAAKHVVSSKFFFKLRAAIEGQRGGLKPGSYVLRRDQPYGSILDRLGKGPPPPKVTKITITEGRSRFEASALLKKTSLTGNYFLQTKSSPVLDPRKYGAPRGVSSLEGFLFPATYVVREGGTVQSLITQQLTAFRQRIATIDMRAARRKHLTSYDVLVIASMIEREAALDRERPLVAAVIYNRLKQGIPLGIDATIRYADNNWTKPLRQSELDRPGPYNTRLNKGLPPTPIGSPGLASIQAAAHPARVSYIYYVVKDFGCLRHAFSSTDAQFQKDAARYQAQQRGGAPKKNCK